MQVMDNREFEQDHVLIGKKGEIGKATVTNDPILMSMLSTGLYANPLRSMVQEVTFNAWDAHRMGNCLDKPIDIYFNDTTGLIIRDYGPGIPPGETFTNVYFTYGGSTKRDDDNATGGFGLGSKSPFAYTDTFNVTNHHNGKKHMHIMHRVHNDNDGGPGHTPIIEGAPTTEKGLMVSIPFKNSTDKIQAYHYLKEILYLSGIKATIHYAGNSDHENIPDTELIISDSLAPTEFVNYPENAYGKIFAVYGGVSYRIPIHNEYQEDYDFLKNIASRLGDMYIGFAPNTLTPLPTREGLNMSERSIESITTALESIQEHFMELIVPVSKILMLETLKSHKTYLIQPHFTMKKWSKIGTKYNLQDLIPKDNNEPIINSIAQCNIQQNKSSWNSLCRLIFNNTCFIMKLVGRIKFNSSLAVVWCKVYPEHKEWRHIFAGPKNSEAAFLQPTQGVHTEWSRDFIKLWKDLCDVTDQTLELRTNKGQHNSRWEPLTNIRAAGGYNHINHSRKLNIIKRLDKENKLKVPTKPSIDALWWKKDGSQFQGPMVNKSVIVAKTLASLNKTNFNRELQKAVVPNFTQTIRHSYNSMYWESYTSTGQQYPVAAFVIHQKKDGYVKAVQWLEDQGYNVIKADEPEKRAPKPKTLKAKTEETTQTEPEKPKGFPKVCIYSNNWEHTEEYVQRPSTYVYVTKAQIQSYGNYPNIELVQQIQNFVPNMVVVHRNTQANKLDKAGALSLWERLDKLVEDILVDKERLVKLYMHYYLHQYSEFPDAILQMPQMQKLMGVPYIRTKDTNKFFRDLKFLQFIAKNSRFQDGQKVPDDLRKKTEKALQDVRRDESLFLVRKMNNASQLFNSIHLANHVNDMTRGQKKVFIEKLARFLRTV